MQTVIMAIVAILDASLRITDWRSVATKKELLVFDVDKRFAIVANAAAIQILGMLAVC